MISWMKFDGNFYRPTNPLFLASSPQKAKRIRLKVQPNSSWTEPEKKKWMRGILARAFVELTAKGSTANQNRPAETGKGNGTLSSSSLKWSSSQGWKSFSRFQLHTVQISKPCSSQRALLLHSFPSSAFVCVCRTEQCFFFRIGQQKAPSSVVVLRGFPAPALNVTWINLFYFVFKLFKGSTFPPRFHLWWEPN